MTVAPYVLEDALQLEDAGRFEELSITAAGSWCSVVLYEGGERAGTPRVYVAIDNVLAAARAWLQAPGRRVEIVFVQPPGGARA